MSDQEECSSEYKYEFDGYFSFSMPYGKVLKIIRRSTFEIEEENIDYDEKVDGVIYTLTWNGVQLPWHTTTHLDATAIALGCQWGAKQMFDMRYEKHERL